LNLYSKINKPDVNNRVEHVRTLIARARISHLCEVEIHWNTALLQNRIYNPLKEEVFICEMIYFFIVFVHFQIGDVDTSRWIFKKATECYGTESATGRLGSDCRDTAVSQETESRLRRLPLRTTTDPPLLTVINKNILVKMPRKCSRVLKSAWKKHSEVRAWTFINNYINKCLFSRFIISSFIINLYY